MNQRIGYARVSTDDQNLDLQRDALHLAGVQTIYEETASGKTVGRPALDHCLKALRAGDTLVVWRLDRLGRSLPDLVHIVAELEERGIGFESIAEKIETTSAAGKLVFHVFAPLADRAQPDTGTHSGGLGCRTCARPGLRSQAEAGDTTNSGDQADDV
jgi:DNA invertase Pin-like site-specific DNA recombinase